MLELEVKTYEKQLSELLKTDPGKFVLIKDENVIGTFYDIRDALQAGYEKFKREAFLVRQILPVQKHLNFANHNLFI